MFGRKHENSTQILDEAGMIKVQATANKNKLGMVGDLLIKIVEKEEQRNVRNLGQGETPKEGS